MGTPIPADDRLLAMTDEGAEPFLSDNSGKKKSRRVHKIRQSLSEQTPSVLLLLALLFGIIAGLVAYIYSK